MQTNSFLQNIQSLLETNLDNETFGVAQLARAAYISECQLYRKVKAETGKSTVAFMRSFRLRKGKELLRSSDLSVTQVAFEVGFNDPAYFSRSFSREYGVSPKGVRG